MSEYYIQNSKFVLCPVCEDNIIARSSPADAVLKNAET